MKWTWPWKRGEAAPAPANPVRTSPRPVDEPSTILTGDATEDSRSLEILLDTIAAVSANIDLETVLAQIVDRSIQVTQAERALLLLYLDDRPQREIAEILGITESNVSTKIGRLKQRIRDEL